MIRGHAYRKANERVFDRFYRVIGTYQSGSGLGVSIVRSIATKAGARIALATAG